MIYNKKDITAIILKNEHDACTPDELQMLEQWYNSLDDKALADNFTWLLSLFLKFLSSTHFICPPLEVNAILNKSFST